MLALFQNTFSEAANIKNKNWTMDAENEDPLKQSFVFDTSENILGSQEGSSSTLLEAPSLGKKRKRCKKRRCRRSCKKSDSDSSDCSSSSDKSSCDGINPFYKYIKS